MNSIEILWRKWHDGSLGEFMDGWRWILSFSKKYKWIIILYTILGILGSSLTLATAWVGKILINIIVGREIERLWFLALMLVGSTVVSITVTSILSRVKLRISIYVNNDIQSSIFEKVIDSDWLELSKYSGGDLLNRFGSDTGTVAENAIGWIPNLIISVYSFAATFILLFVTDPVMAWFAVASAPVLCFLSWFILKRMREYKKRVLELNSAMMSWEVETFSNFELIKSLGVASGATGKLREWQKKYWDYNLDYNRFEIRANIALTLIGTTVSLLAFGYCLWRLWSGQILFGDMSFFLEQRGALTGRFKSLAGMVPAMVGSAISAHRIREIVELPRERHGDSFGLDSEITVTMRSVSFAYKEDREILKTRDFIARPGETVVLTGPSGEGKTTMLRLLLDLLHPDKGEVVLSDQNGTMLTMKADLRKYFSYVPQGNSIMAGTIRENLKLVKEDASDEEMIEALETACAWEFVKELPDGLDHKLGDAGSGLSEGQKQRLAIARAMLRDAPIMLMDEATSALDPETEERVMERLRERMRDAGKQRTCIMSNHRDIGRMW